MYLRPHSSLAPVSGMFQALALNTVEADKQQRQLQARALLHSLGPCQPGAADLTPVAYEPNPEAGGMQRNIEGFLRKLNSTLLSLNPYNDHRFFTDARVLASGWAPPPPIGTPLRVAPGRGEFWCANPQLVARFGVLLDASGFDKRYPVLFDRDGLILDGLHRLQSCMKTDNNFYFLQLDF